MKTLTCECGHVVKGMSEKEVIDRLWKHMKDVHPEKYTAGMKMSKAEQDKMNGDYRGKIMDE